MKTLYQLLYLLLSTAASYAQQINFEKQNFPGREKEFEKALEAFNQGNSLFLDGEENYLAAKLEYEKAYAFNPNNAILNYNLGVCCLKSSDKFKAKQFFDSAFKLHSTISNRIYFYFALCYQLESSWDSSISYYNMYAAKAKLEPNSSEWKAVEKGKLECNVGRTMKQNNSPVVIKNLGPNINTKFAEYTPYITTDEAKIFFTSRREGNTGNRIDDHDGMYFEDIYVSDYVNSEWKSARNAGANINSKGHEAVCGIFPDGNTMIIFKGDVNGGDLFYVNYSNGQWTKPIDFGKNINTDFHESSACLSNDARKLFFVSNKPGGLGGRDIYESSYDTTNHEWGVAKNLGANINTSYDEEGVFLHPDGKTLFFASNGPLSMGGYDILKCAMENNRWTQPINIGIPINTPDDDVFVSVAGNGKNIYFSSFRKDGFGEKDIYVASINTENSQSPNLVMLSGEVVDEQSGKPIDAIIELVDLTKNEKINSYNNDKLTGKYIIPLPGGKKYGTVVYADGYIFESENVDVADTSAYAEIKHSTRLKKIVPGTTARLNNIFFETGKATVLSTSENEIQHIVTFMNVNTKIKIEIQGHTDNVGDANANMELSTMRAKAIYNELIKNNIAPQRLSYKGFGETKPATENNTEKGKSLNRRIEFWILKK